MNPGTKIIIIKSKHILYASIIAVAVIALIIILAINAAKDKKDTATNAPTYNAGVYTSSLVLNGNPVELRVTLDANKIKNVELVNITESVTTMYPLIEPTFDDIAKQVCKNNSTKNISYSDEARYTALILLEAIEFTLNKAIIY